MLAILLAVLSVPAFQSLALRGGGAVIVRHGAAPRVTLLEGDARHTRIRVDGGRLVIDNCPADCPRSYRLRAEIELPAISSLSVSDGGSIQARGGFPQQGAVAAAVRDGGAIDIRALAAADVTASVNSGGLIFARPSRRLDAAVAQGGIITYWGRPAVTRSVRQGGVVTRGAARDFDRPLSDFAVGLPPVPPVPPIQPGPGLKH